MIVGVMRVCSGDSNLSPAGFYSDSCEIRTRIGDVYCFVDESMSGCVGGPLMSDT